MLSVILTVNLLEAATRQRLDIDVNEIMHAHWDKGNNRLIQTRLLLKDRQETKSPADITVMAFVQGDAAPTQAEVDAAQAALPRPRTCRPCAAGALFRWTSRWRCPSRAADANGGRRRNSARAREPEAEQAKPATAAHGLGPAAAGAPGEGAGGTSRRL